ncbi:MAG TPA: TIGR03620 family F420-dependent LLM class oxidoreductase [Solirubrobacterales bacterium]
MCFGSRMDNFGLTRYGICLINETLGSEGPEAASLIEELGFGALWVAGSPRLPELRPLLEATEKLYVNTAVINIWQYGAEELVADWKELEAEFGERAIVGIGVGHRQLETAYEKPLAATSEYLDAIDADGSPAPERRMIAALGPKMLDLAAERSAGSIPYFVPVEHTRFARERMGEASLLAPALACVLDGDPERARAKTRELSSFYMGLSNYADAIVRSGFEREDVADGGSDRMLEAVVAEGGIERIVELTEAHLEAGADHVALQAVGTKELPRAEWREFAAALID